MANKKFVMGMLVMALIFGMAVVGCDSDGSKGSGTDPALNGTWVGGGGFEITFLNGKYQKYSYGYPVYKGTYTTSNGILTENQTHFWGGAPRWAGVLESKWYTKADLKAFGIIPDAQLDEMFEGSSDVYSVSGNLFYWGTGGEGEPLTRK